MKERLTFPSDGEQGLEISCNFAGVKYDEQMENQSITKIQVRPLQIEDYGQLAQSFRRVYSDGSDVFWTHEQIETLLRIFPEGQVVTVADDKIIGCALSIIVDYDLVKGDHTYAKVTGNETFSTHNPKGNILYGIEVFIHPDYRGLRLARRMYEYRKELCEKLNLKAIMFGGRIPNYHKYADKMRPKEYIEQVRKREIYDPVLTFQLSNDFHVREGHDQLLAQRRGVQTLRLPAPVGQYLLSARNLRDASGQNHGQGRTGAMADAWLSHYRRLVRTDRVLRRRCFRL